MAIRNRLVRLGWRREHHLAHSELSAIGEYGGHRRILHQAESARCLAPRRYPDFPDLQQRPTDYGGRHQRGGAFVGGFHCARQSAGRRESPARGRIPQSGDLRVGRWAQLSKRSARYYRRQQRLQRDARLRSRYRMGFAHRPAVDQRPHSHNRNTGFQPVVFRNRPLSGTGRERHGHDHH